jgi:uncharacterized membrane protein SpoIIM required for sporulation/ABC-type transport system involved in multi-copper enzyme maturation permease subunit
MAADSLSEPVHRRNHSSMAMIGIIVRRELRDTLRDWRIVSPIAILTLFFPWLMNWAAQLAVNFVRQRQADIIGERMVPFLLMIVGFFPISFSLIIALETFVGEKERRSIEPLLATPVTDLELYLGKMIAATVLPLIASLVGVSIYLGGLYWSVGYVPPLELLILIFVLNITGAVVMVAGAVVVSSQTTSVRAANLLASFIIVPMAVLIQGESVIMFWGHYRILWAIVLGLVVVGVILVRMGVKTFNREGILGREIDELDLRRTGRLLVQSFVRPPLGMADSPHGAPQPPAPLTLRDSLQSRATLHVRSTRLPPVIVRRLIGWLGRVYRRDLPYLLRCNWMPLAVVTLMLAAAIAIGWAYVGEYPLPQGSIKLENLSPPAFDSLSNASFSPSLTTGGIFWHNVWVLALAGLLAVISLGVLAVLLLMVSMGLVGFVAGQVAWLGYNPLAFLAAFILPHGLFEMPAAAIATAFALRLGASVTAPRPGLTVGEGLVVALADLAKVFIFLVVPLLLIAAFVEANLTPQIVLWAYGR